MYVFSYVQSATGLFVRTLAKTSLKVGLCVVAAACASVMLVMPVSLHAQPEIASSASSEQIQVENQVDINTADAETLALALDGVGMAKAQDIIAYREQNGNFKSVDDLQNVRGIGKATLERNRSRILVAPSEE
jgi:competence protein ComEA